MTKVELIAKVAADAELTKKDAERAVNAVLEGITAALKAGDKVSLVGFGTFETRKRPERTGRNPRTKETIKIPATVAPRVQGRQGPEGRREISFLSLNIARARRKGARGPFACKASPPRVGQGRRAICALINF